MKKIKRLIVTSTALVLLSSGINYCLCKNKDASFNKYLKKYQSADEDDLLVCAHRGFSSLGVENTYQALSLASSENYIDCIEIDARMTKDGKIVLSHDNILWNDRLVPVKISDLTYDEVIKTNFKYRTFSLPNFFWYNDEHIMVNSRYQNLNNQNYHLIGLSDGIKACGDKTIIIDLKLNNNIIEFTEELKREIVDAKNIIFQSFDAKAMLYIKEHSNFDCMLLMDSKNDFEYINNFKKIAIDKSLVTYDLVKELINNNINIFVWTINSSHELDELLEEVQEYYQDITYITNYPDLILTRINERKLIKTNVQRIQ